MLFLRVDDWDWFEVDMPSLTSTAFMDNMKWSQNMAVTRMDCSSL